MSVAQELIEDLAELAKRPYDFVFWAWPWGEEGTDLADRKGPDPWQARVLFDMQQACLAGDTWAEAYQIAIRSGHDIGKTACLSWIAWWAMSTAEDTIGRATANTDRQLKTILWKELAKWHRLFIAKEMFRVTATALISSDPDREKTWRMDAIPWSEDNPEAFAGLHNYGKRVIVIFDEASAIHDKIWEVVGGVMAEANTELFWIAPGNPTRNHGRFYECWHRFSNSWRTYKVDSRQVTFTNKAKIQKDIDAWGIESDYIKVRWLGEFPNVSATQLIPKELITAARQRAVTSWHHEALVLSLDVARFGTNESVLGFRRGKDARTIPIARWRGLSIVETANRTAAAIAEHEPDAVFVDEGGVGGGVVDILRSLGHAVLGVNFGSSPGTRPGGVLVGNKRAEMYVALLQWLREGGCIEDSDELEKQLLSIEYFFDKKNQIMLVPKEDMEKEGFDSPDIADELAMTFAWPVSPKAWRRRAAQPAMQNYDPYGLDAMPKIDAFGVAEGYAPYGSVH